MEPVDWSAHGPRSPRFDDIYFQADGLEESRAVFLRGCGLPEAWSGRRRFVVGELGFGAGLNVLALLQLWRDRRPSPDARLHVFSVEGYPMPRADAARALAAWPELAALAAPLLAAWPDGRRGRTRVSWPELGATLDLAVEEAQPAVQGWDGRADAWFLDGFAPARNPQMWSPELLAAAAVRTAPGGRLASFTVAGGVRRALADAGLEVGKRPGHGRKRERLEAHKPSHAGETAPPARVAVVGAGIAAAALVRALGRGGIEPVLLAPATDDAASGNASALVTPRLDAGGGATARLHAEAFARAVTLYSEETPEAVLARGAWQLARTSADSERFARLAAWGGFRPGALAQRSEAAVAAALGEAEAPVALKFADALVVEPRVILKAWMRDVETVRLRIVGLRAVDRGVELVCDDGRDLRFDAVVLANGAGLERLLPEFDLRPTRGQASVVEGAACGPAAAWGGYAIPTREGVLFGATHGRGDRSVELRPEDDAANLRTLEQARPALAARLAGKVVQGRAATRLAAPDHLPLAGATPDRPCVWVLGALGARGFTLAPLLAEHLAARIAGAPSPLAADLAAAVEPARRAARRGGAHSSSSSS